MSDVSPVSPDAEVRVELASLIEMLLNYNVLLEKQSKSLCIYTSTHSLSGLSI